MKHTTQVRVRFAETDGMGVVYHGRYLEYFEAARVAMMDAAGIPYTTLIAQGYHLPVIEAQAKYRVSAKFDDVLSIEAHLHPVDSPRIKITYRVLRGTELLAEGHTVHAFINTAGKATRPPAEFVKKVSHP